MKIPIHSTPFEYLFFSKSLIKKRKKDLFLFKKKIEFNLLFSRKSLSLAGILGENKRICLSVTYRVILTQEKKNTKLSKPETGS